LSRLCIRCIRDNSFHLIGYTSVLSNSNINESRGGTEAAKQWSLLLSGKPWLRTTLGLHDHRWNPAIFLVLFKVSVTNCGIHTDDPTGCCLIPFIFMKDALSAATHSIYLDLCRALSYARFHTLKLGLCYG